MGYSIACTPSCWGVKSPNSPDNPPWMTVLTEARQAGFQGLELGPYGYFPTNPDAINTALYIKEFMICAGNLSEPLFDIAFQDEILAKTSAVCALLNKIGASKLIVSDSGDNLRSQYAGFADTAPRLDDVRWQHMVETLRKISAIAHSYQVYPLFLPCPGSYIEYQDEIDRLLDELSPDEIGLCLDTGYLYYAGMDPASSLKCYEKRLGHLYLKDIDDRVLQLKRSEGLQRTYADRVICPIGEGAVNYHAIFHVLEDINYQGWVIVEQQSDGCNRPQITHNIKRSYSYLLEMGLEDHYSKN